MEKVMSNSRTGETPVLLFERKEVKMGFVDIALIVVIIAGAGYLLYRSVWKKKGHCGGCGSGTCDKGK